MLRTLAIGIVAVVGAFVALLAVAFAAAQTPPAKDKIADVVADKLSGPQRQAEVQGLGGLLPFDIRVGRIALRDDKGVWLEVNKARVKLSPTDLLRGDIHVEDAGAERVAVDHLPPPGPPAPPSSEPFKLPQLPQLPESLPKVQVDRLHLDSVELHQPVLGEAATFSLEGTGGTGPDGRRPALKLALRRTDQPTASLDLDAHLDLAARNLGINLQGSETGGLMAALTKRPEAGPLHLSLVGDGPLDDWRGRLQGEVERLARLDTTIDLAYASTHRVGIDGTFTAAPGALPPDLAPVVGNEARLALHAGESAPGVFRLDQLLLQAGALSLTGSGTDDTGADRLDGRVQLQVPSLADLSGLAGTPLAGQAGLTLGASGRVQEPALSLDLAGSGITAGKATLAQLGGGYDVTLLRAPDGAIAGARIDGSATADGLAVDGRQLGDGRAALEIRAEAPPAGETKPARVPLRGGPAGLALGGAVARPSLQGQLRLGGGVPDLAAVLALVPQQPGSSLPPLRGALSLDGTARLGEQANRIDADLTLTGQNLQGLPPGAQELIGPAPKLTANATVEQKKAVNVGQLRLEGAALTVSGDPKLGLDRKLGGTVTAELPDLAKLEPVTKQPTAGRLTAKADLGGTLDAPAVKLDATADALRFGTQTVDRLRLTGTSAGPVQTPAGNLALTATRAGQQLQLAADYALANQRLRLPKVELTGPATRLAGDLQLDLQRLLATGRLAGGVSDLDALSAWTQQKLGGAVNLDLALATPDGRQDATLKADVKGIAGDFGRLEQAGLDATVRDARGKPAVDATATAAGFTRPDLELKQAQLAAKGPLDRVGLTLAASGQQAAQPFDVKAAAEVAALGEDKRVTLSSFGGKLAGQQVQLVAPARLALDKGVLDLDQLDLKVGPAQVQGSLRYGNGSARGEVRLAALPLGLLQSFGAPALKGTAQGSLQLTGTTKAPQASLDLTVSQLQPGGAGKGTPAADLRLTARTQADRLDATLTAAGLGSGPLQADAGVPLRFSLEPFAFDLRQDAPLTGKVQGGIDLAKAAALAALDRQQVRGTLTADLRFAGTLSQPQLGGSLQARNGRVDDLTTGMSLRSIALTANASGRRIDVATLSATDRASGKLGGRGSVTFGEGWRPSFDVSLDATRLRVLDSALGIALVSGNATAQSAGAGAAVRSRLTVNEADIKIPDKTSVSVPTLDVVQKGQPQPPAPEAGPSAYPVSLDVAVDAPERVFVRGRGLDSEWGGNVKVAGVATRPEITGQIKFRRGFADVLG